jgi:hypothetical protein
MRNRSYLAPESHACSGDVACHGCGVDCCPACVVQLQSFPYCIACVIARRTTARGPALPIVPGKPSRSAVGV